MKMKGIFALATLLFAAPAFADINVLASPEACANLTGQWNGSGKVTAAFFTCHYKGVGTAQNTSPTSFTLDATFKTKDFLCPEKKTLHLAGTCQSGNIHVANEYAKLNGTLNDAGNSALLNGEVYFKVAGKNVTAQIENMRLNKQ